MLQQSLMMPNSLPRRTHAILRARTGCLTCRGRKKKCGEEKPICRGCNRNKLECIWPTHAPGTKHKRQATNDIASELSNVITASNPAPSPSPPAVLEDAIEVFRNTPDSSESSPDVPHASEAHNEDEVDIPSLGDIFELELPYENPQYKTLATIPPIPSILPQIGQGSFDLLSHYLSRTANSMGNGSTESNPFVTQLVPLAFSSELILRLILTQSAAQRALQGLEPANVEAREYYTTSLGLFRNAVTGFISGSKADGLMIAAGALILCFTETAKGDTQGIIFDHLAAAQSMLLHLLENATQLLSKSLKDFLVEYYTYTATLSMISVNPLYSEQLLLSPDIARRARDLVDSQYVGHLCGCWLELLLFIPQIFELRRHVVTSYDITIPVHLNVDDIVVFSELYHRILYFVPNLAIHSDTYQACFVFQKAVILYHLTVLETKLSPSHGSHRNVVNSTIADAMAHLALIPPSSRINTSLCWPLAVIGSCCDDETIQSSIRLRLQVMSETVGLGNIDKTLKLLEHMWCHPIPMRNPWTICEAMQEHDLWISFA